MYCYFSASRSHPPILLTSLYPLCILLKKLCELCLSETPVFYIGICLFVLYVLPFFSQLQPPPNPSNISLPGSSSKKAVWVIPVWDLCVCVIFFCYWQMLIKFYIACTAIFQPVTASPQSCWHIFTWQCFKLSWKSSVSYLCLRLLCFFFLLLTDVD